MHFGAVVSARSGRHACSAILANGIVGMIGFWLALSAVALAARPLGAPTALVLAMALSMAWSLGLTLGRRRFTRRHNA